MKNPFEMRATTSRKFALVLGRLLFLFLLASLALRAASTIQDFDQPGTAYSKNPASGGNEPAVLPPDSGSSNNFLRLAPALNSMYNTIYLDRTATGIYTNISIKFDFRITPSAGRADGMCFVLLNTATHGSTGISPATSWPNWLIEEPNVTDALGIGFDIYNNGPTPSEPNNNHVSLHWNGAQVSGGVASPTLDLASGRFHRAQITIRFDSTNAYVTVKLTPDIYGTGGQEETLFNEFLISGVAAFESRAAFGARTGGFAAAYDLDQINIQYPNLDTTPPTCLSGGQTGGGGNYYQVKVRFSEVMDPAGATNTANYTLKDAGNNPLTLAGIALQPDGSNVVIRLDPATGLQPNAPYILTISNVRDLVGNSIAPGTTIAFTSWPLTLGRLRYDYFAGIGPSLNLDTTLLTDPRYPDQPMATYYPTALNSRLVFPDDSHDSYGARITGIFIPLVSGNYVFYLRSDDISRLYLNPNGDHPGGKVQILEETGCCGNFSKLTSAPQALIAGQRYFIEVLHQEGGGGDYVQVAAKLSTDPTNPDSLTPIPGAYLAVAADPLTAPWISILQQPTNQIKAAGETASFTVAVAGTPPHFFQWFKNGAALPTATNSAINLQPLDLGDAGNYFVVVSNAFGSATSAVATLTVVIPPGDVTNGLVAYYPFDGDVNDASGNGNHGVYGGPTPLADIVGSPNRAYYFDQTIATNYVQVNDSASLHFTQASVSVWVRPTATRAGVIVSKDFSNGGTCFHLDVDGQLRPLFGVGLWSVGEGTAGASASLTTQAWHHLAGTYDGSSLKLYVDGELVNSVAYTSGLSTDNGKPLVIGQKNYLSKPNAVSDNGFTGGIDEVRIYNRPLTAAEVLALYRFNGGPEASTGPIATNANLELTGSGAFDGVNYLGGIKGDASSSNSITAQLVSPTGELVGARIVVGRAGSAPYMGPQAAFDGTNYLLIWEDAAAWPNQHIYGQRISPAGALVGGPFPISSAGGAQIQDGLVHNLFVGGDYLVTWVDFRNGSTNVDIYGQLVSPNGTLDGPEIPISTQPSNQRAPAMAFDGANSLVIWQSRRENGPELWDTYGRLVSKTGALGSMIQISESPSIMYNPANVVFNGTNYLVIWNQHNGIDWNLEGRFVSNAGAPLGNEFPVVAEPGDQILPGLAFDGANFLLCWSDHLGTTNGSVKFQFVNPQGNRIGAPFTPFTAKGALLPLWAGFGFLGNRFAVSAEYGTIAGPGQFINGDVYGGFFTISPPVITAYSQSQTVLVGTNATLSIAATGQPSPSYQWYRNGVVIPWATSATLVLTNVQFNDAAGYSVVVSNVYGSVTSAVSAIEVIPRSLRPAFSIATSPNRELPGSMAFDGINYLFGIQGDAVNSSNITAQLVSRTGSLVAARISVGRVGGSTYTGPHVAFDGTNYLMAWEDAAALPDNDIYGQFISPAGTPVGTPFPISQAAGRQAFDGVRQVSFDGGNYLVIWADFRNGSTNGDLYGQWVTPAGGLLGPEIPISTQPENEREPMMAFDGINYLVIWLSRRSGEPEQWDTVGRFISTSGILGNVFQISQSPSEARNPDNIAFDGTNYLAVWSRKTGQESDLYGRVVTPTGSFLGNEFPLVVSLANEILPSLAFDGANYLLGWSENYRTTNATCKFRFFDPAGSPVGSEFAPFDPQGFDRPLFAGSLFDGTQFLLTALLGVTGAGPSDILSGDLYGRFYPPSFFSFQNLTGGDDFNDNFKDANNWGTDLNFGTTGAQLDEARQHLEFTAAATNQAAAVRSWILNYGSYTNSWEVQADLNLGNVALTEDHSHVEMFLAVANSTDSGFVSGDSFSVALDLYRGQGGPIYRTVTPYFRVDGVEAGSSSGPATASQTIAVRISFDAASKTLSSWYDTDAGVGGYQWTLVRAENIAFGTNSWQMNGASAFAVVLGGSSEAIIVTSVHEVFADNFSTRTLAPLAIATPGLLGRQVGLPYGAQLTATGGAFPYQWSQVGGQLPTGLALNAADGVLSGMPSQVGLFHFTVRVTDAVSNSTDQAFSVEIYPVPGGFPIATNVSAMQVLLPFASITVDGNTNDWLGIAPAVTDPQGDSSPAYTGDDLKALYVARDADNLYVRLDLWENVNTNFQNGQPPHEGRYDIKVKHNGTTGDFNADIAYNSSQAAWQVLQGQGNLSVSGNVIELQIPFETMGQPDRINQINAAAVYGVGGSQPAVMDEMFIGSQAGLEMGISAAFDGTNYLVGLESNAHDHSYVAAQLISPTGALLGPKVYTGRTGGTPMVAFDGTNYFLAWTDDGNSTADDIYGALVSPLGALVSGPFAISAAPSDQELTHALNSLLFDGVNYLVVWSDGRGITNGSGSWRIYGQRISPAGSLVGGEIQISAGPGKEPSLGFNGSNYLVAWHGNSDVFGQFLSRSGALIGSNFVVDASSFPSDNPLSVASDGTNFMVAFPDEVAPGNWDLFARLVSASGVISSNRIVIAATPQNQHFPNLVYDRQNYLASWLEGIGSANLVTKNRFFSPSGFPAGPEFELVAGQGSRFSFSGLLFDGQRFLVLTTWSTPDFSAGGFDFLDGDVYGQFVKRDLLGLPSIVQQPQSRAGVAGSNITLNASVNAFPPVAYQWYLDNVAIPGATSSNLTLGSLSEALAGTYLLEASNVFGKVYTQPANLSVLVPPQFVSLPQGRKAVAGETVLLQVEVTGTPPFGYEWRRNGVPIVPLGQGANILTMTNVQPAQQGVYTVVVTNAALPAGIQTAGTAVEVWERPIFNQQPQGTNVVLGQSVVLCASANGTPPLRYQWRKNGVNLEGATNACLVLINIQASDGGSYSVNVANEGGTETSQLVEVVVQVPVVVAGDNFADRVFISGMTNLIRGTNIWATREEGESKHANKVGTNSVWYTWQAPQKGIATFATLGSTFDTLLAVYQGIQLTNLNQVVADEDKGGFFNSSVQFNAEAGQFYIIAIDGFAGDRGEYILGWLLEPTVDEVPIITNAPISQTVSLGSNATFTVEASGTGLHYQWHHNGQLLPNATNASLALTNMQVAQAGAYEVAVTNTYNRSVRSAPAYLEIGDDPQVLSVDKLEDLPGASGRTLVKAHIIKADYSVSAGTVLTHILNNYGSQTQKRELDLCNTLGGASRELLLTAPTNGIMVIDTVNSEIDTVLSVFGGDLALGVAGLTNLACDDNGAPDGMRSLVRFPVQKDAQYVVHVDGVNGAEGVVYLNWGVGVGPWDDPQRQPLRIMAQAGVSLPLTSPVSLSAPPPTYQWLRDGVGLAGMTNVTLMLNDLGSADSGQYAVVVSNRVGVITSIVAQVQVEVPLNLVSGAALDKRRLDLVIVPGRDERVVLQSSPDLRLWHRVKTNAAPGQMMTHTVWTTNAPIEYFRCRPQR